MDCAKRLGWGLECTRAVWEPSLGDPESSTVGGQPWRVLGPRVVPGQAASQGNPEILRCEVAAGS